MFSARFDGGETEIKFRQVHAILRAHNFDNLMVAVSGGGDFGRMTMRYLGRLDREKGVMLAVCTANYAEITGSNYSSFAELKFAYDNNVYRIPLIVGPVFPPEPPSGPDHKFDKEDEAKTLVKMALPPSSLLALNCREKSAEEIALMIAENLLAIAKDRRSQ